MFKLQVQTTVDGYMAGPNGEMDWMTLPWTDDMSAYVNALAEPGGDLIAYGGGNLAASLIAQGLLDELYLFVNPTAIGAGMPVFPKAGAYQRLRLVEARPFGCGITALRYGPKRD